MDVQRCTHPWDYAGQQGSHLANGLLWDTPPVYSPILGIEVLRVVLGGMLADGTRPDHLPSVYHFKRGDRLLGFGRGVLYLPRRRHLIPRWKRLVTGCGRRKRGIGSRERKPISGRLPWL